MLRAMRSSLLPLLVTLLAALVLAPAAGAHAQLESSSPERGQSLTESPKQVEFHFSESVEAAFGALRVYDKDGERVDSGTLIRPDGQSSLGVRLKPDLADGSYTATYRVVSADSHPVSGGVTFTVGRAAAAPVRSIGDYLDEQQTPQATQVAYTAVRLVGYLALVLLLGVAFFDGFAFMPAARMPGVSDAVSAFAARATVIKGVAAGLGVLTSALAIVFQGAAAVGESFFAALNQQSITEVLDTRSGSWMLARLGLWLLIAVVWAVSARGGLRRGNVWLLILGVLAAQTPALIGHAAVTDPSWAMVGLDFVHIVTMSIWIGGIFAALFVLPRATATLAMVARTRLLVAVFDRFSRIAMVCVGAIVFTGVVQSLVHFSAVSELTSTSYGRAILAKIVLLAAATVAAAVNRQRSLPDLRRAAARSESPAAAGRMLRDALRVELALTVLIVAVASALVGYAPPRAATAGPLVVERMLGPAQLQLVVDPARRGNNQIHLYLTDPETGAQFTDYKGLTAQISREAPPIPPIDLRLERAGPGHHVDQSAQFAGAGRWLLRIEMRRSEFDQDEAKIEVPVR